MTTDKTERIRRNVPPRTGPIRSAAAFVRPPHIPERAAASQGGPGSVERAVDNAYRVLDEQLRRGEEAARAYQSPFERGGFSYEAPTGLPRGMIRLWSEVLGLWLDVLGPLVPSALRSALRGYSQQQLWPAPELNPGPTSSHAPTPAPEPEPAAVPLLAAWTRVTLDVSTTRPVEVSLDLSPDAELAELVVQDLGAFDGEGKPPITGAKLEPGPANQGRLVLRLSVGPDQPPGTYLGMILDRTYAEQRGTLRVLVRP